MDDWEISWRERERERERERKKRKTRRLALDDENFLGSVGFGHLSLSGRSEIDLGRGSHLFRATIAVVGETIPDGTVTRPTYDATLMFDKFGLSNGGKTGRVADRQ